MGSDPIYGVLGSRDLILLTEAGISESKISKPVRGELVFTSPLLPPCLLLEESMQ